MGMEQPAFTELDKLFQDFLNELQKNSISDNKINEIERKMHEALKLKSIEKDQLNTLHYYNDRLIHLNMNKLNKSTNMLKSAHIKHSAIRWASGLALFSAGLLFITIGFTLIVTPASPEFEIATIFYFNEYDGVTVMDLFALVIIFMGIYLFIRAFIERDKNN